MSESSQEDKTDNKQNGATIDPEQRMEDVRQNIRKAEVEYLYFVILLFCCCCCCSVVDLINKWASEGGGGGGGLVMPNWFTCDNNLLACK